MKTFKQIAIQCGFMNESVQLTEKTRTARPIAVGMSVTTPEGIGIVQSIKGQEAVVFIGVKSAKETFSISHIKFAGFRQGNKVKDKNGVLGGKVTVIGVKAMASAEDIIKVRDTDRSVVEIPEDDLIFISGY